ncbi:PTS transporter subunit EIIC [Fusobacterium sp.]|uniref:PTS transporter subunit EIIC n=1 Tax=Fusobacterium sp. TaxID=68766 RepID=UPI002620E4DC|nr:PTS transporter subunit EIIC [Fusobacterium sp.]MDY3058907.1 PTS transporter subunit EIIC [Fusobacterium sp.]MEE1474998.1 PTS transporter subunit EIIC [Fusobacterium sp.]
MAQIKRDYPKLAKDIIREVGGKENIVNATRCATRLRLVLKETPEGAKEKVQELTGVITVVENSGQFQVVIGTHVGEVYENVMKNLNLEAMSEEEVEAKQPLLNRIIATMSAVFAPFIYILAAAGILQGILILINLFWPQFATTGTYEILSLISWTPFAFLPILIGITASKHFKCNTFIAVTCCAALINPTWVEIAKRITEGEVVNFLFFNLSGVTYGSSVLPPLFLVLVLSYLEHFLSKRIPEIMKALLVPFICMIVMVPLTILIIGPLTNGGAEAVAVGFNLLMEKAPLLGGILIGGLWEVFVIFGVHWGITPMVMANFSIYGYDAFQAFQTLAVIAQIGAAIGCFIKSKNSELKKVALSASVTGIFGITEPTLYGVTLRLKKPFICACVGGAISAAVMSFFNTVYYAYAGLPGILTIVNAINPNDTKGFIGMVIGSVLAIVVPMILVLVIGFDDPKEK